MFGRVGIAVGAGLVAGSLVGGAEALYALQSVLPAEYQALIYAMCLYGVCGAGLGLVAGILLLPARRMGAERRWMLSLVLVGLCLGGMVLRAVVDRDAFEGRGVPADVGVALAAGVLTFGAVTAWIGTNLLTKTPLRGLARAQPLANLFHLGLPMIDVGRGLEILQEFRGRQVAHGEIGSHRLHHDVGELLRDP